MKNIKIISGADKEYKPFYDKLKQDCSSFGYDFVGYDFGGLGEGIKIDVGIKNPTDYSCYVGKIPGKPAMILDALERFNEFVVYLDSDVRIKQRIDEVVGDYDFGVTVHPIDFHTGEEPFLHITGYLNAGVIFAGPNSKEFINEWIKDTELSSTKSDQEGLTNLLRRNIKDWTEENHIIGNTRIKFFPSPTYNYTGIRGECENPKLIHYTGTINDKIIRGALK